MIRFLSRLLFSVVLLGAAGAARADGMAIFVKNGNERAIALELHGNSDHVWPGGDQVYMIEKKMQKSIPIECEPAEKICYGAWLVGDDRTHWGVGPDNTLACSDCCTTCVAKSTFQISLQP